MNKEGKLIINMNCLVYIKQVFLHCRMQQIHCTVFQAIQIRCWRATNNLFKFIWIKSRRGFK